jgi:hypothetical protein
MTRWLSLAIGLVALAGCQHLRSYSSVQQAPDGRLAGPKVVVFVDTGDAAKALDLGPTRLLFTSALKSKGFAVKRFAKDDGSIRYALELRGTMRSRCRDGGFDFEWLEMYVIDLARNETVMVLQGSGYTEGCVRHKTAILDEERGTLFRDLTDLLSAAWTHNSGEQIPEKPEQGDTRGVL